LTCDSRAIATTSHVALRGRIPSKSAPTSGARSAAKIRPGAGRSRRGGTGVEPA
jgi:hypothetical protein